ncbi:hypothetical protein EDB89DRAFT_1912634 [Lactarius sanguifluus]|nr:hypothetical protein EDB89DRAFT_1912634 [Lactarius sanguifluus]
MLLPGISQLSACAPAGNQCKLDKLAISGPPLSPVAPSLLLLLAVAARPVGVVPCRRGRGRLRRDSRWWCWGDVFRTGGVGGDASGLVNRVGGTVVATTWCRGEASRGGVLVVVEVEGDGATSLCVARRALGRSRARRRQLESCVSRWHGVGVGFRAARYWWWWRLREMGPRTSEVAAAVMWSAEAELELLHVTTAWCQGGLSRGGVEVDGDGVTG